MGLLSKLKKEPELKTKEMKGYCFIPNYKDEELIEVLQCNPLFELSTADLAEKGYVGKRVFKYYSDYDRGQVTLEKDPKNKEDKNAVKILLSGHFFGYINRDDAPFVGKLLKKDSIQKTTMKVTGGPTRTIITNKHSGADRREFDVKVTISYYD